MGIISKIIQKSQKSRSLFLTDFAHPFCPYFTENFYRFMHNLRRCFCPRFSQKTLQFKGYFKVAEAIFPPLFTPKFFSHQAFSNTAALAIAQLPPPCTDASMSVFRHTPLPQTQQPHRQPSPLKRVEFASKLQEKLHAANAAEHRENFAARKIQPRLTVSPDMTECGTAQKMHIFQTSKRRQPRRRTRAGTLCAQAIPTRSKCRSNGLPTHSPQFRSLLKHKKSQTFARARACATKTGARTRQ